MNSNENIENRLKKLLKIKNKNEKDQLITEMIHLKFMNELALLMDQKSINKSQLAKELNVSKSYITQLFTADKILNLKLISQIQDAFNITFGMTLNGEYMATVPVEDQPFIKKLADEDNISTNDYVQNLLNMSITVQRNIYEAKTMTFSAAPPDLNEYYHKKTLKSHQRIPSVATPIVNQGPELSYA